LQFISALKHWIISADVTYAGYLLVLVLTNSQMLNYFLAIYIGNASFLKWLHILVHSQ